MFSIAKVKGLQTRIAPRVGFACSLIAWLTGFSATRSLIAFSSLILVASLHRTSSSIEHFFILSLGLFFMLHVCFRCGTLTSRVRFAVLHWLSF